MTGRTRRASTSSVETVDGKRNFYRQETSLLKSVSKGTPDIDWPTYELRDAVVLNKDGETLESALDVGSKGPFTIRGTLMLDEPGQRRNLLIKVRGDSIPFEIRQCVRYSIGVSPEEQPIIWVAGKSGFFEINPSPAYRFIYHKMCEATMLYYRIMDAHRSEKPKKLKKKDYATALAPVLHQYSALIGDGSTFAEVVGRCREHAPFLISHIMQEVEEDFDWQSTLFYKWLVTENSDDLKKVEERLRNPPQLPRSPSIETNSLQATSSSLPSRTRADSAASSVSRSLTRETESKPSIARQRSSRSRSTTQKVSEAADPGPATPATPLTVPSPAMPPEIAANSALPATDDDDPFATVLATLEWAYNEIASTRDGLTPMRLFNKVYFSYKFPNFKNGQTGCHRVPVEEVFHYNAKALLRTIDEEKYRPHEIYSWLQEAAEREFSPVAITQWPYPLIKRGARPSSVVNKLDAPRSVALGPVSGSASDDAGELSGRNAEPLAQGLGRGKRPGRRPGIKSSLRLATTSKKRPFSEVESDSESDDLQPKKSHYFANGEDTLDGAVNISSDENEEEDDAEPIEIIIRADKMPSTVPHGPDGTWVCDQEDCDYVVRGGDATECQERIRDHFEEHNAQMQRVNLALTESRGHLPINHLLDRIKHLGEKAQQNGQLTVDGVLLPKPIKRKLIV